MKIFQILNGKCHWQTPFSSLAETYNKFPADCLFVEAPDYVNEQWGFDETQIGDDRFIKPVPPEGWIYDEETGQFMPEEMVEIRLEEAKAAKQNDNNALFAKFLAEHPMTYTDGKVYGVTLDDQQEIALNITSYQIAVAAGVEDATLEWHAQHEACTPWTLENLSALSLAIRTYIYPYYTLCQSYKTQIYACETVGAVEAIELIYQTPEEAEASKPSTEPDEGEEETEGTDTGSETSGEESEAGKTEVAEPESTEEDASEETKA